MIKVVTIYHVQQNNAGYIHTVKTMRLWMTIDCSGMLKISTFIQTLETVNERDEILMDWDGRVS